MSQLTEVIDLTTPDNVIDLTDDGDLTDQEPEYFDLTEDVPAPPLDGPAERKATLVRERAALADNPDTMPVRSFVSAAEKLREERQCLDYGIMQRMRWLRRREDYLTELDGLDLSDGEMQAWLDAYSERFPMPTRDSCKMEWEKMQAYKSKLRKLNARIRREEAREDDDA